MLHGQGGSRFHVDAFAGPEDDAMTTGSSPNGDPPVDDKNGSLVFDDVDRPLRAAYRRNRLRCDNPICLRTGSLRNLEQQGLAAQVDCIHTAIAIAIEQGKSGAIFGHDGHPVLATESLHGAGHIFGRTPHVGLLRDNDFDWEEYTCEHKPSRSDNRFHGTSSRFYP
jgi:hypothetical protein